LSAFFALLTLLAYTKYVKGKVAARNFWIAPGFFHTSASCPKPMLVILPFVMLFAGLLAAKAGDQ